MMRPMQQLPAWVYFAPVLAALVGGAVALVGVFMGPWVKARTDLDQWRRERRLDSYAELARTTHDLIEAIVRRRDAHSDQQEGARQGVERAVYELARSASRVQLVGDPAVRNASVELLDYVAETIVPLTGYGVIERQPFDLGSVGLGLKYDAFMDAARHNLGVP